MSLVAWSTHDQMFSCTSRDARTVTYCKTARRYRSRRLSHGRRSKTARRSATDHVACHTVVAAKPRVVQLPVACHTVVRASVVARSRRSATVTSHVLQSVVRLPVTSHRRTVTYCKASFSYR